MRFTSSKFREMQTREFPHGHNGAAILFLQSLRQVLTALQHRVVEVLDGLIQLTTRKVFHSCGIGPPHEFSELYFAYLFPGPSHSPSTGNCASKWHVHNKLVSLPFSPLSSLGV